MQEEDSDSNDEDIGGQDDGGDDHESSEESAEDSDDDEVQETGAKPEPGKAEVIGETGTMGDPDTPSSNLQQFAEKGQVPEADVVVVAESQEPEDPPKTHEELDTKALPSVSMCSPKPEDNIAKTQQGTTPLAPEEKGEADGQGKGGGFVSNKNVIIYSLNQYFMCVLPKPFYRPQGKVEEMKKKREELQQKLAVFLGCDTKLLAYLCFQTYCTSIPHSTLYCSFGSYSCFFA